jgi:cytochrome subunit of sulfide dehydrogenase
MNHLLNSAPRAAPTAALRAWPNAAPPAASPAASPAAFPTAVPAVLPATFAAAIAVAAALLAAPSALRAQDAASLRDQALAATCAQCHGTEGRATAGAALPGLAGLPAPYLAEQMQAFKAGARPGTIMPQLAKGYSDAQIAQLAAYFARSTAAAKP